MNPNTTDPRSLRRLEDNRFLRGTARYIADMPTPGQLHAAFIRSPHANAAIRTIDTTAARNHPGVHGVFTATDLLADGIKPVHCAMALASLAPLIVPPRHALAANQVRHVGEAVAMVLADSPAAAQDAAEHVSVEYEALPAATDPHQALSPGAPQVWPQAPGNLAYRFQRGDPAAVQAAFATAAHSVTLDLVNNRVVAAPLETRGLLAEIDAAGRLRLTLSGQDVHGIRRDLAHCFNLDPARIHVLCPDVGGGFGLKNVVHPEYVALLWAARRLQRPVRWIATRTEDFTTGAHGRDNRTTARLALDAAGRFLALGVETIGNLGAYVSALGPGASTNAPSTAMAGLYAIPAVFMDVRGAFTNTAPIDAYRGAGKPEANYIIERLIDTAAHQLGHDRIELRRQNLIRGFPYTSALGITIDTGQFPQNLNTALAAIDHAGFPARRAAAARRGRRLGLGLACFLETSRGQPTEDGAIRFHPAGRVDLVIGSQSNGQGLETSFTQIAATRLGLPLAAFHLMQADTDQVPRGGGHGGARSIPMAGTALVLAIEAARAKAHTEAARLLQTDPARITWSPGRFTTPEGASLDLATMIQTLPPGTLDAEAHNPNDQFVFPNGCHAAELEVDPETGAVTLQRYIAVDDYGTLVNPLLTESQVQGGLAQGIGQALLESIYYDPETGQLLSASFSDYTIPRATDLPGLEVRFNEHPTTRNPLGAKGAGQAGAIGAPQTIMNALTDAIGVAHIDMPATPERVWRACQHQAWPTTQIGMPLP